MQYSVNGTDLLRLGNSFGMPLFVYDAAVIQRQIERLRNAFDVPALEIRYACKALSTREILRLVYRNGCGIDTVSEGEIRLCLNAGIPAAQISFTPSGVAEAEYDFAARSGVRIHVDQLHIIKWLDAHYPGHEITIRFNPGITAGSHVKLQVGAADSKFGFHGEQLPVMVKTIQSSSLVVRGVHMHLGSDIEDARSTHQALDFLFRMAEPWQSSLQHIDIGGGFKVPYQEGDKRLDLDAFGLEISAMMNAYCESLGRPITLTLEPGKFLVSEAGCFLIRVNGIRHAGERPMIYLDSGFNHFVRPMNYDAYHHILNLSNPDGPLTEYDVVGYLCETDTFAIARKLPEVRRGDVLCLLNAGAYGYTMASNYNARLRPAEVLWNDGTGKLIRRAETMDDLLRTESDLPD